MKDNIMRKIKVGQVTLNIGMGPHPDNVAKAAKLLELISGRKAIQTKAKKKIPAWDLRPGVVIGAKVNVRGAEAVKLLKKLFEAIDFKIKKGSFTECGFSFGIEEYINIGSVKYDPSLGMLGLDVCVTLERPGYRIKRRKIQQKIVPRKHRITAEEAIDFAQKELGVKVE